MKYALRFIQYLKKYSIQRFTLQMLFTYLSKQQLLIEAILRIFSQKAVLPNVRMLLCVYHITNRICRPYLISISQVSMTVKKVQNTFICLYVLIKTNKKALMNIGTQINCLRDTTDFVFQVIYQIVRKRPETVLMMYIIA